MNISLFTRGYFFLLFILVFSSLKRIMNVVHPVLTAERKQFNYCNDNYKVYARQEGRDDGRVGLEKLLNRMENAFDALWMCGRELFQSILLPHQGMNRRTKLQIMNVGKWSSLWVEMKSMLWNVCKHVQINTFLVEI